MYGRRLVLALLALPLVVLVPGADAGLPRGLEKWAVLVGVDDYAGGVRDNIGANGDVADLHEVLRRNGFHPSRVKVLTDREATADGIRGALDWLVRNSHNRAFSVFHFSGHVKQMSGDPDRDGEDLDEFLWGADNRYVSDAELTAYARRLRGYAWIDIAGCEAAGLDDGLASPRRLFTGSSREDEKSYEHPEWRNSIFTGLMADFGTLRGSADYDRNGAISIHEAFRYAAEGAPQLTSRQRKGAQHPVIRGGDGSNWYLSGGPAAITGRAAPRRERTVTVRYYGPSTPGAVGDRCVYGCFSLKTRHGERYVRVVATDASGLRIAVAGPFGTACGSSGTRRLPSTSAITLRVTVSPQCVGVPTAGVLKVTFSTAP